uniref:Uncharacterized protein AlNc14C168G7940 n=1 Tax=Albugo laibachii Nc14 TaxID=890382 RepID=F0WNB0_9STRA|nr:hypothetical protein PITG_19150 [Albugo laibachii Nc14]|eukprot:CCA22799.1 hypothetical protein PITG_19150 [Albugo laibachii Nc14]
MENLWRQLYEEYQQLDRVSEKYGRQNHSMLHNPMILEAIQRHGIPSIHREWAWPLLLHTQTQKLQAEKCENINSYEDLIRNIEEVALESSKSIAAQTDTKREEIVEERIFTNGANNGSTLAQAQEVAIERFDHLNQIQEDKIKRIMLAYTESRHEFYYCHGMVEICVVLSTFLSEEDSFWGFRLLMEVLLPKYHEASILDFQVDCLVLQELLDQYDPILGRHFNGNVGITVQLLCTKWFFSFFAESIPFEVVCRLYDLLFVDICCSRFDAKVIFATSLAILLYLSRYLVEVQDPSVMIELIVEFCFTSLQEAAVANSFLDLVVFIHSHVNDKKLQAMRQRLYSYVKQQEEQFHADAIVNRRTASVSNADAQERARSNSRKGRGQNIRLIIQWKHFDQEDGEENDSTWPKLPGTTPIKDRGHHWLGFEERDDKRVALEIVTTPTQMEVLEKLDEGIRKVNRRRSNSTSLRMSKKDASKRALAATPRSLRVHDQERMYGFTTGVDLAYDKSSFRAWDALRTKFTQILDRSIQSVWQSFVDQVRAQSLHGIPEEHRSWVWVILLEDVASFASNIETLSRDKAPSSTCEDLDTEVWKAIETDISRTRDINPVIINDIRQILIEFARRNRRVGYCQGMNEILIVLLRYLDKDHTLCALILLIEELLPAYHVDSMIGLHTDCAVMDTLLFQNDIQLHAHLQTLGLNMEILCTKWLVTCFLTSLPVSGGMQVIDMLFTRAHENQSASRVLLGVGIAIFFTLRLPLLETKDAGEVLLTINEYLSNGINIPGKGIFTLGTSRDLRAFLDTSRYIINQLEPSIVHELRLIHKDEVMDRFAAYEAKKIEMRQQLEASKQAHPNSDTVKSGEHFRRRSGSSNAFPSLFSSTSMSSGLSNTKETVYKRKGSHERDLAIDFAHPFYPKMSPTKQSNTNAAALTHDGSSGNTIISLPLVEDQDTEEREHVIKMEEQLYGVADLYLRGRIDEKEHACIKAQIIRKWCQDINQPTIALARVAMLKEVLVSRTRLPSQGAPRIHGTLVSHLSASPSKKLTVSLYRRMKKMKKSVVTIFKATF